MSDQAMASANHLADLDGRGYLLLDGARVLLAGGRTTDALLLEGERIRATGDAARHEAATLGSGLVRTIRLPGGTVGPGFIDAHTHLAHMGFGRLRPDLSATSSPAEALERVRTALSTHDPERPLIAEGWDDASWAGGDQLRRQELDRLSSNVPILLRRVCGHKAVANTAALDQLTAHPDGATYAASGLIERQSGTLVEDAAMRLGRIFPPSPAEVATAVDLALDHAARLGITSAHDIGLIPEALRAHQARRQAGRETLRIIAHLAVERLDAVEALGLASGLGDLSLKLGGVKLFLDGSLGARTAALSRPYADRASECGLLLYDQARLNAIVQRIDSLALSAVIHAIGDGAIAAALSALESLGPERVRARRHRIEHCELTPDDLVERMARSGAVASMQPNFVALWGAAGAMYEAAIGGKRWRWMNRFRSLSQRGVPLAFGSDVMPMEPIMGLRGAIQHPIEEERLTPDEALAAYTAGSAYAGFAESETGTIEPGKLADLALFAGDPRSAGSVAECPVVATIVGGKTVFAAAAEPRSDSAPDRAARGRG